MKKQIIATAALALGATAAFAPTAQADDPTLADTVVSFAAGGFDSNQNDFDIVSNALVATDGEGNFLFPALVTAAANAEADLTVFLPTDKAFRILVEDLLGVWIKDEAELFGAIVETVGVERVGEILAYHIVAGVQADANTVVNVLGDGAEVDTVNGDKITLDFKGNKPQIRLVDIAGPGRDPIVRITDVDAGSNAIAHVIDRVLIPGN